MDITKFAKEYVHSDLLLLLDYEQFSESIEDYGFTVKDGVVYDALGRFYDNNEELALQKKGFTPTKYTPTKYLLFGKDFDLKYLDYDGEVRAIEIDGVFLVGLDYVAIKESD